ncbi:MAG: nucleotidyltransferase [Firmicutes bacterium]|nr:nucleotidyltransferase [Bacillota bacterium]
MKVVGLVTEYNPFHNGHLYHLNKSKNSTGCDYSIAVMSGNFLQRGEPALVDKWSRARMAIDNGVDLVIELPTVYACQSAEFFAYGAISILDKLGVTDYICFGSESGDIEKLDLLADILYREPDDFQNILKDRLATGIPFPQARTQAITNYLQNNNRLNEMTVDDVSNIMSNPNNILALEYLKALKKLNSSVIPYTIQRMGAHYNSEKIQGNLSSATAIRTELFEKKDLSCIRKTVPLPTYSILEKDLKTYGSFNRIDNFNDILIYLLRSLDKKMIRKIFDVDEGLENRIKSCSEKFNNINSIIDCIKTKRYTYTRLQRIMMHLLLGLYEDSFLHLHSKGPSYIRVLAFNKKGIEILNKAKKTSKLPIITKFANYSKLSNNSLEEMIRYDIKATDIYFLGLKKYDEPKVSLDFLNSPYIKNN